MPVFGLLGISRRTPVDEDIERVVLRYQVRILEGPLRGRVRYRPVDQDLGDCSPRRSRARQGAPICPARSRYAARGLALGPCRTSEAAA